MPAIQIRQQYAKIGIESRKAELEIKQPRPDMEISNVPAKVEANYRPGKLEIDQSKAWDALGIGNHMEWTSRIYSESRDIALQGIAKIVENGNRMAKITAKSDAFAEIALNQLSETYQMTYYGPASYDNVDIHYTPVKPEVNCTPGELHIKFTPNMPEFTYTPGSLNIYLEQRNQLDITPPSIDVKI